MSDAGDDIPVDAPVEEVAAEAPKGKLSVEEALQVCFTPYLPPSTLIVAISASPEERARPRRTCPRPPRVR